MLQLIISTALLLIGGAVCARKWGGHRSALWFATLFICNMVFNLVFLASYYFTGHGIDESVVFHLRIGLADAGISEYLWPISLAATLFFVCLIGSVYIYRKFAAMRLRRSAGAWKAVALLLGGLAVISNPAITDSYGLLAKGSPSRNPVEPPPEFRFPKGNVTRTKNIVYVYLESVERTYLNNELFPGLTPNLSRWDRTAISYTDIRQVQHTSWTIAGMVASQCGIPLITQSGNNAMSGVDRFLPKALCLGDILEENDYHLSYLGGASLGFAGKGNFYRTHGFHEVLGRSELSEFLENPKYKSGWGLYDDSLFTLAKEKFTILSRHNEPFGLVLLTLDTHSPNGHVSRACEDLKYGDGANPILNAVYCTDSLVADFVDFIRESEAGEDTIIVIASDHLSMRNSAWNQLQKGKRRNLFLVLDPEYTTPKQVSTPGSTLDVASTLLARLGFEEGALGFGRNLDSQASLTAQDSHAESLFENHGGFITQLWAYPSIDADVAINAKDSIVSIADRTFKTPTLLVIGDDSRIEQAKFEFNSTKSLLDHLLTLSADQPFIWVDKCTRIFPYAGPSSDPREVNLAACVAIGQPGSKDIYVRAIKGTQAVSRSVVHTALAGEADKDVAESRRSVAEHLALYGVPKLPRVRFSENETFTGDVVVRSSAWGDGPSYVAFGNSESRKRIKLRRGLTLLGFHSGRPTKLKHVDTCNPRNPVTDPGARRLEGNFLDVIQADGDKYSSFAIAAYDSAYCGNREVLTELFSGSPFAKGPEIGHRQPYIAFLFPDGSTEEWLGKSNRTVAVNVLNFVAPGTPDVTAGMNAGH